MHRFHTGSNPQSAPHEMKSSPTYSGSTNRKLQTGTQQNNRAGMARSRPAIWRDSKSRCRRLWLPWSRFGCMRRLACRADAVEPVGLVLDFELDLPIRGAKGEVDLAGND